MTQEMPRHFATRLAALLLLVPSVALAQGPQYGGRAFGASITGNSFTPQPQYIADTGALPATGGWLADAKPDVLVPGVLKGIVPSAATSGLHPSGFWNQARSESSMAAVVLLPQSRSPITASFVRAATVVGESGPSGVAEVRDLKVGATAITVTGQPNQRLILGAVGVLVINEQRVTDDSIVVNALHLKLHDGRSIIVASADSSLEL